MNRRGDIQMDEQNDINDIKDYFTVRDEKEKYKGVQKDVKTYRGTKRMSYIPRGQKGHEHMN
jgi:hypothetical protein